MIFFLSFYNCFIESIVIICPSDQSIIQFCLWHPSSSLMVSTTFLGMFQVPAKHQDWATFTSPASTCHLLLLKTLLLLFLLFIVPGMSYLLSNSIFPSWFNTGITSFMKAFPFFFFFLITALAVLIENYNLNSPLFESGLVWCCILQKHHSTSLTCRKNFKTIYVIIAVS